MLWIGPALGPIERACIRSVLRHGHPVTLYCYRRPDGVPEGVQVADAAEILPESSVIRHHTGSPSLFSNRFRYELQRQSRGVWLDSDVYMLAPLPDSPYLMGRFAVNCINAAVLRLPPDCPMLGELLTLFEERSVPPWLPFRERLAARCRLLWAFRTGLSQMPWGSTGPHALTALARKHGLCDRALPEATFYPVPWQMADWIRSPRLSLDRVVRAGTVAVHLWNERIKHLKDVPGAPGSFLERLQTEGA